LPVHKFNIEQGRKSTKQEQCLQHFTFDEHVDGTEKHRRKKEGFVLMMKKCG